MSSLEELIRNKNIVFHSYGRDIDTDIKDFGEYNWDLVNHIEGLSGNCIRISGAGLEEYIKDAGNLYRLADFAVQLAYGNGSNKYKEGFNIHVDVDIDKFKDVYSQPSEEPIVNGFGHCVSDAASWVPEMPYFEKLWNFALCSAIGGMVGYPGYEHPLDDESFRYCVAEHAQNFIIGTVKQLGRYKKYANDYLNKALDIANNLMLDPNSIFREHSRLMDLEIAAKNTRRVAENIVNFTADYETKDK